VKINFNTLLEIGFCLYALLVVVIDIHYRNWMGAAILAVYAIGFAWVALAGIWESLSPLLHRIIQPKPLDIRIE
jgi:hypothetical protein